MKTLGRAAAERIVALWRAAQETDESRRRRLMTFVWPAAGLAGVETVGTINDFLHETCSAELISPNAGGAGARARSCCPEAG
jgi:NADH dehydrogenase FAD-containing subunit